MRMSFGVSICTTGEQIMSGRVGAKMRASGRFSRLFCCGFFFPLFLCDRKLFFQPGKKLQEGDEDRFARMEDVGGEIDVRLKGSAHGGDTWIDIISAPLECWSVQRIDGEYRVWIMSTKQHRGYSLWYCLQSKSCKAYADTWDPWRKTLHAFKVLLQVIGKGPPPGEGQAGYSWGWGRRLEFNDVDASTILDMLDQMQPQARKLLESEPEFAKQNFLDTLCEEEYAGVDRKFCNPKWKTLNEYFDYCIREGKPPVRPGQSRSSSFRGSVAMMGLSHLPDEFTYTDEQNAQAKRAIRCKVCGGWTRHYEESAGVQHYMEVNGKRQKVENAPSCMERRKTKKKKRGGKGSKGNDQLGDGEDFSDVRDHGPKRSRNADPMGHQFGRSNCPLCSRVFVLPDGAADMEEHLRSHLRKLETNPKTSYANQIRLRTAFLTAEMESGVKTQ